MFPSTKFYRWLLAIILLGSVISLSTKPVHADDTVINFDSLAPGTLITSQYHDQGVDFIADPSGGGDGDGVPNLLIDPLAPSASNVASLHRLGCGGEFCTGVVRGRFTSARQRVQVNVGDYGPSSETAHPFLFALDADLNEIARTDATVTGGAGYGTVLTVSSTTANIWYFVIRPFSLATRRIAIDNLQFDQPTVPPLPDFGLVWKSPPVVLVPPGRPGPLNTTVIGVIRLGGSSGPLDLTVSGLPTGMSASLTPSVVDGSTDSDVTLTLMALDTAPPFEGAITVTGTPESAAVSPGPRSVTINVSVPAVTSVASPAPPQIRWGGRTVAIDASPGNTNVAIAASESGGLFLTGDAGKTWFHADSLPPFRMTDVKYAPDDSRIIIASAFADSSATNQGGIWRSTDGGLTWQKPSSANPPCVSYASTYGIAFAGDDSQDVYAGTDCGLAVSHDLGATWTHVTVARVYSAVAQSSGIVDICGVDGHHRSTDHGATFGVASAGLPNCTYIHSIATAPHNANMLFTTRYVIPPAGCDLATGIFEGDVNPSDAKIVWTPIIPATCKGGGRDPWVATHPSADGKPNHFDIYFGSGLNTYRQTCPGAPLTPIGISSGCSTSGWSPVGIDHSDQNAIAFGITASNCAQYIGSDGGVHTTSDCGATWKISSGTASPNVYSALQLYEVTGQVHPGAATDLYIGTQDNQLWASGDSGKTWPHLNGNEGYHIQLPHSSPSHDGQIVTYYDPGANNVFKSGALFTGVTGWHSPGSDPLVPFLIEPSVYVGWGIAPSASLKYILYFSTDTGATWAAKVITSRSIYGRPYIAGPAGNPTIYQGIEKPGGNRYGLLKITGIRSGAATISPADSGLDSIGVYCMGQGTFVCPLAFGVDPNNAQHLIAADAGTGQMKVSTDGGASWSVDATLTTLVTRFGTRLFNGPSLEGASLQPHVITFDPADGNRILVGTEAAGIIASTDGGKNWHTLPNSSQTPAITGFFFDEVNKAVFVSTYGRGLWKMSRDMIDGVLSVDKPAPFTAQPARGSDPIVTWTANPVTDTTPLPYLQIAGTIFIGGQNMAATGDTVTTYGSGFCGVTGCSPVTLRVGDRVVTQSVPVNADGTFTATFTVTEGSNPGQYPVTALQTDIGGAELSDVTLLIVPTFDDEDEEEEPNPLYLPLIAHP